MSEGINLGDRGPTDLGQRREGFADVARWIVLDSDGETSIYRKFRGLAARNLLYLQAELLVLEKKLNELDEHDVKTDDMDLKDAARTWETLTQRYAAGSEEAKVRIELIEQIRAKLREYHEALLLESEISKLMRPNKRVLDAYRLWFKMPFPALGGLAKAFLDVPEDLVGLNTAERDHLSLFLRQHWPARLDCPTTRQPRIRGWQRLREIRDFAFTLLNSLKTSKTSSNTIDQLVTEELSRDGLHRIGRFETSIAITVVAINIVVAALLLVGSIVSLYWVTSDAVKLVIVALFTAAFALSVGLMSSAKRAEIFASTAAYAAVLVVFVSGSISNSGGTKDP